MSLLLEEVGAAVISRSSLVCFCNTGNSHGLCCQNNNTVNDCEGDPTTLLHILSAQEDLEAAAEAP